MEKKESNIFTSQATKAHMEEETVLGIFMVQTKNMEEISDDTIFFLDSQFSCVYSGGFVG